MNPVTSAKVMAAIFAGSGTVHLIKPEFYEGIMPTWVPAHREVILGSGVLELLLAAGLLTPATRKVAGWGSVALLVGVFPANIKMAVDAVGGDNLPLTLGAFARLPLQWPMIKAALAATQDD